MAFIIEIEVLFHESVQTHKLKLQVFPPFFHHAEIDTVKSGQRQKEGRERGRRRTMFICEKRQSQQQNWSIIMRFYLSSTVGEREEGAPAVLPTAPIVQHPSMPSLGGYSPAFLYYFNTYCSQFLEVSNLLNQELLKNNNLITDRLITQPPARIDPPDSKKDSQDNSTASRKNASQFNYERIEALPQQSSQSQQPRKRRFAEQESSESYRPEEEYSREATGSRVSESKNIPKNYGKAIITFIRKNEEFTRRVLAHLGLDYAAFMRNLRGLRGNLNTISQLRSMWMQQQNDFARAYRVLSLQYLRKHSLSYIFNSRVQNFYKHIKYRYKIIESVSDPTAFTCMKEF